MAVELDQKSTTKTTLKNKKLNSMRSLLSDLRTKEK